MTSAVYCITGSLCYITLNYICSLRSVSSQLSHKYSHALLQYFTPPTDRLFSVECYKFDAMRIVKRFCAHLEDWFWLSGLLKCSVILDISLSYWESLNILTLPQLYVTKIRSCYLMHTNSFRPQRSKKKPK